MAQLISRVSVALMIFVLCVGAASAEQTIEQWQREITEILTENRVPPAPWNASRVPRGEYKSKVNIIFRADGEIISTAIVESTGSEILDDRIIRNIYRSSPLPAPPASINANEFSMGVVSVIDVN